MSGTQRQLGVVVVVVTIESMNLFGSVDVRKSKPVESYHKNLSQTEGMLGNKSSTD